MTKEELYDMGVEKAVEILHDEIGDITSYDALISYAKAKIDDDNIGLAIHILQAIYEDTSIDDTYYYKYDYSMGTLETPTPITSVEDLEEFCDD